MIIFANSGKAMKLKSNTFLNLMRMLHRQACLSSFDERLSTFSYWNAQYQKQQAENSFDWFLGSNELIDTVLDSVNQVIKRKGDHPNVGDNFLSFLDLGCGRSDLPTQIFTKCQQKLLLVVLDFIPKALENQLKQLSQVKSGAEGSTFLGVCADVAKVLPFVPKTFDFITDKGTMDALLKDKSQYHNKAKLMMSEALCVLAPGGRYLQISDEDPDSRLLFLEDISHRCQSVTTESSLTLTVSQGLEPMVTQATSGEATSYFLPMGSFLSKAQLLQCPIGYFLPSQVTIQNLQCKLSARRDHEHSHLSSWSFKVLSTSNGTEYFLYWTDKNLENEFI